MKILIIRGKNLASLEGEFEIDFTKEPLQSSGIFAITGSTGSGKSTILDALTLALYDDTPRINKTKGDVKLVDSDNLNQKDTRNILRRGTAEGYAEVEFISLGDEHFRATWSVRRSRDKIDGALQASAMRLFNISQNREVSGGKTEIKKEIERLIGLTFEQFTRSVLLAQGDFATFLKATQGERSELLEKLTGTEIYSDISKAIYAKSMSASAELKRIQDRIDGIEVLSEEQLKEKVQRIEELKTNAPTLDAFIQKTRAKIEWIKENKRQEDGILNAKKEFEAAKNAKELAKSRIDYLRKVDQFQEIKPIFMSIDNDEKDLANKTEKLESDIRALAIDNETVGKNVEEVIAKEKNLKEQKDLNEQLQPQIKKAIELDTKIVNANASIETAKKGNVNLVESKKFYVDKLKECTESLLATKQSVDKIEEWYQKFDKFKDIIPDVELIAQQLDILFNAERQKIESVKLLKNQLSLLKEDEDQLLNLNKKLEELNSTLATEIIILRSKLKDGVPCPVCGSIHHPLTSIDVKNIKENELETTKATLKSQIEKMQTSIKTLGEGIATIKSQIERCEKDHNVYYPKISGYLTPIGNWEENFKEGKLQNSLRATAKQWNEYSNRLLKLQKDQSTLESNKKNIEERLKENEENLIKSLSDLENIQKEFAALKATRNTLIYGKAVNLVQETLSQNIKKAEAGLEKANQERTITEKHKSVLEGSIAQLYSDVEKVKKQFSENKKVAKEWMEAHSDRFASTEVKSLMNRDVNWIASEREALSMLDNTITKADSILRERNNTFDIHQKSLNHPSQEDTEENLNSLLIENMNRQQEESSLLGALGEQIKAHNEAKKKIKTFENEFNSKKDTAEDWNRLNSLFGSAEGKKFRNIAQEYTLDILLAYANIHLQELTDRYRLERIPDSLALQVIDGDMMDERRSVNLLSGGESFLVSLALALGLSSLTSNRMNIESLYIDEGFGSLDMDTLRVAMEALDHLQTQGKKIGVISHVEEMKERIHTQIRVIKSSNGRSRIEIVG